MWNREELVAQAFFQRYLIKEHFPLELDRIAYAIEQKLDIDVYVHKRSMPDEITAQLQISDWVALIYVNQDHSIQRQRFGVAHEFGHLLLEHEYGIEQPGLGESNWENEAANNFAAALLMPAWKVKSLVKKYPDSLIFLIQKTSNYFGVSTEAAARRLATTDFLPGLATLLDPATGQKIWEYHSPSIHLDHEAFHQFLVRFKSKPKKREEDLEIMGYPFRVEFKRVWGDKFLLTCLPFTYTSLCAREIASSYM